ncbi:hypothetical protein EBE87_18440 [Pseudoroseomonas wenyumeiae]|uniref:Uncharacterized protein n=1 Tax=Teichococcus wenyumeiae TaxID=2478470 RepID=A0A3A9JF23_9PROT|nr:hypothetical protein [Pseudoroseomonas wenyumeiae]RKK05927.1 hypothetical protein D6Z83_01450 [Pseudoroseomonas wenyumeiae]RMI19849.1 hypothetical protein EBE87_18440 [Pseudoroseomonas wenyumeiae]
MTLGAAHPHALAAVMPGRRAVWEAMVRRHGLRPHAYEEVVRSWEFLDFTLRHGETRPRHSIMSTVKARQHGFGDCTDSEAMFRRQFRELQAERILPPNPALPATGAGVA